MTCRYSFNSLYFRPTIMSTVANVERKIRRVEGFRVRILHLTRVDVRGDRSGLPQYGYHRAADSDFTVEQWKATRFRTSFPGFEVDVMDRRGNSVQGNMKLVTVREAIFEEVIAKKNGVNG